MSKTNTLDATSFLQFIRNNSDAICEIEEQENYKIKRETKNHIDLAIQFIGYYEKKGIHLPHIGNIIACSSRSLSDVLLALYKSLDKIDFLIIFDERRYELIEKVFRHYLDGQFLNYKLSPPHHLIISEYSSMMVFDSADLEAASDRISAAFDDNSSSWKIRNLFVQESCYERFVLLIKSKLRSINDVYQKDAQLRSSYNLALEKAKTLGLKVITTDSETNEIKPTLIVGQNRNYFDNIERADIPFFINLNIFRTAKEAVALFNTIPVPYASIWTQNISIAHEIFEKITSPIIWSNCVGHLTPKLPYGFAITSPLLLGNEGSVVDKLPQNEHIKPMKLTGRCASIATDNGFHYQWSTIKPRYNNFYDQTTKSQLKIDNFYGKKFLTKIHNFGATLDLIQNEKNKNLFETWITANHKLIITAYGVTFAN